MSQSHDNHSGDLAGPVLLFASASAEAAGQGLSAWTGQLALLGFLVTVYTSLPKIVEANKITAAWVRGLWSYYRKG